MIIEPPDKGWVVHVDEDIDNACDEDGLWTAHEISTDHFVLDSDTAAFAYGKHFLGRVNEIPSYIMYHISLPVNYQHPFSIAYYGQ